MLLTIPDEERKLLYEWMLGESSPKLGEFLGALEGLQPALNHEKLAEEVSQRLGMNIDVSTRLIRALINLCVSYWRLDETKRVQAFASAIGVTEETHSKFTGSLERIVRLHVLEVTGKALSVLSDNPNVFIGARTLSEMRPVCREDDLTAEAFVILHQLKIEYISGRGTPRAAFFVALDRQDLEKMRNLIDRTIRKHDRLLALKPKLEVPLLD